MFKKTLITISIIETLSLIGFFFPLAREATLATLLILAAILIWKKNEYAIYIMIAELIIGSKGYLLYFDTGSQKISLRIALWLLVMSIWLIKALIHLKKRDFERFRSFVQYRFLKFFILLFGFAAIGALIGFLNGHARGDIVNDFNAWIFLLAAAPFYYFSRHLNRNDLVAIASAAVFWSSVKTIFLLFLFSHDAGLIAQSAYRWVRTTGIAEITKMQFGFFRIFLQSHIYQIIFFFPLAIYIAKMGASGKRVADFFENFKRFEFWQLIFFEALLWTSIILSLSRSNWLGLLLGCLILSAYYLATKSIIEFLAFAVSTIIAVLLALALIASVIYFPLPGKSGDLNLLKSLSDRLTESQGEAAVSSRWELLPSLWHEVASQPLLGQGFGTIVTYRSSDPRVLEGNPSGNYSTFSFEWGWLDIWLKTGLSGLIIYLFLVYYLVARGLKSRRISHNGLALSVSVLAIIHFFSPYLNHPLGIGFLLILGVIYDLE